MNVTVIKYTNIQTKEERQKRNYREMNYERADQRKKETNDREEKEMMNKL